MRRERALFRYEASSVGEGGKKEKKKKREERKKEKGKTPIVE